jgi:hypothetical protein
MIWRAESGQSVREVMGLDMAQREMTLRQYAAKHKGCAKCGQPVPTYETPDGLVCWLCDGKSDWRAA